MFKKILQSLSKSQAAPKPVAAPAKPQPQAQAPAPAPAAEAPRPKAGLPKAAATSAPAIAAPAAPAAKTPEELCEIAPKMPKEQIQARLRLLYRRYNRGASSLDPKIRAEADQMLHAIVLVREKHFGEI